MDWVCIHKCQSRFFEEKPVCVWWRQWGCGVGCGWEWGGGEVGVCHCPFPERLAPPRTWIRPAGMAIMLLTRLVSPWKASDTGSTPGALTQRNWSPPHPQSLTSQISPRILLWGGWNEWASASPANTLNFGPYLIHMMATTTVFEIWAPAI